MDRKSKIARGGMVVLICAATLLFSSGYLYMVSTYGSGQLYSVRQASEHLLPLFRQNVMTALFPMLLCLLSAFILKRDFPTAMYLRIQGKTQAVSVAGLSLVLAVMAAVGIMIRKDTVTILYNLFYYLVFVAFTEEIVIRGVCVYLLRDFSWKLRYLLPNVLFALMHIFAYHNFEALTSEYVFSFLVSNLPGLLMMGCVFQLLKEKTGTLWVPILVHTICDFAGVFTQ